MRSWGLALCFSLLAVPVAHADVVEPPPTDCPDGARGFTCHGGTGCEPVNCMLDSDCSPGQRCGLRSLCIGSFDCFWSGNQSVVTGACDAGQTCAPGSMCVETRYCLGGAIDGGPPAVDAATLPEDAAAPVDAFVPADTAGGAGDAGDGRMLTLGGCGCRVGRARAAGAMLVLAIVAGTLRSRRRAR